MNRLSRKIYLLPLVLALSFCAGIENNLSAQIYPVQLTAQLIPPYNGYLLDYADPSSEKLKFIFQFNDFTVPQYNIRLRLEIQGNGFSISTKQIFNPPPIIVQPGIPYVFSGSDLAPYLNSKNLDFVGINQYQYDKGKTLPEGHYSICVKAYDYYLSNTQVSNESCAQAWFTLSDPPFLNMPFCNSIVTPLTPQNIVFQWTPMNMGSPNSAFNTEYDFELWEMRPDSTVDPNQLVLSTSPIYKTTTHQQILNYGIVEPPLNLYMKYAWRVRARDINGYDLFKNKGYSQVCTFSYGSAGKILENAYALNLSAQGITHRLGKCFWTYQNVFTSYLLQVRKKGTTNWFDYRTTFNTEKIPNLEPATTYEARVRGEGKDIPIGSWSSLATFTTLNDPIYACNDQTLPIDPLQAKPLPANLAIPGLIIQTGQFEVFATEIFPTGSPGWYGGKGYARVLGAFPLAVQWKNIYIDDNNRHQQGLIEALTRGIDYWTQQWDLQKAEENAAYVSGVIDTTYINGNQVCVVLQGSLTPQCFPFPPDENVLVIRDENGNQYTITTNPPPAKIEGPTNYITPSTDNLDANDSTMVTFSASANQNFGFDKKEYVAYTLNYEAIKLNNGKYYFVPYKSVGESKADEVVADIQIKNFSPTLLSFKTKSGAVAASQSTSNNQYKVTVPDNAECIYAWYGSKKIGKLNVISLKPLVKNVVLVPVNGANTNYTNTQIEINKIFQQANVSWTLKTASSFTFDLGSDGLEAANTTLMSKYSKEMRALRDAFRNKDTAYDKNAYYIFVVPQFNDPAIQGYMVRGRAVGFVSASATSTDFAHELAHGAFGLEHTFPKIEKSTSTNLMDYSGKNILTYVQWAAIQLGKFVFNWLDGEEDGAIVDGRVFVLESLNQIKTAYQNNISATFKHNSPIGNMYIVYDVSLAGVKYPYIKLAVTNQTVKPRDKIVEGHDNYLPHKDFLNVDGHVRVFVPKELIPQMKEFLTSPADRNLLLFVGGYIPFQEVFTKHPDVVYQGDVWDYWGGIDSKFINAITTKNTIYANGSDFIKTSNHKTHIRAASSFSSMLSLLPFLNDERNVEGFYDRYRNGINAGDNMLKQFKSGNIHCRKITIGGEVKIIDTLDVVCHSMGYAYSLGMINTLQKADIHIGRFYIIAPENGCTGSLPQGLEEAWQYGSFETLEPIREQDGVAPQCPVVGILAMGANGGRIQNSGTKKGWIDSHLVTNYSWIFNINSLQNGYVKKRL